MSISLLAATLLLTPLAPTQRAAPQLDDAGKLAVDDAAFSLTFDGFASIESLAVQGYDENFNPLDTLALGSRFVNDDELALQGNGAMRIGGDTSYLTIDTAGLTDLVGRRVELTVWQKSEGTRMQAFLYWYGGNLLSPDATYLGALTLQPTGNVTSDGWEEFSSGPFDYAWGGAFPPITLSFSEEQVLAYYGGASYDIDAHVMLDALTIRDLGEAAVPPVACTLPTEATACGDEGVCHYGVCVDGAIRNGGPLVDDTLRSDYLDRRAFEISTFEGGRAPLSRAADVSAVITALKGETRASAFWPKLTRAYDMLVDGHASSAMMGYPAYVNGGVCLNEGEADLLDGRAAPMVFDRIENAIGAQLEEGDVLTAIDGLTVDAWIALASRLIGHPGDPEGASVVRTPQIINAALDTGAVLTFARCSAVGACEDVVVDLKALTGDMLLAGESPTHLSFQSADAFGECDYRFRRGVDAPNVQDYEFAGFADDVDGDRHLLINGVPYAEEWFETVEQALNGDATNIVLDQRTGGGGTIEAVDWLAAPLLAEGDAFAMDFLPGFENDTLEDARSAVVECWARVDFFLDCGNGMRRFVGETGADVGASGDAKLAVLIASDVSGNDYLTRLLVERSGETRIFGAGATWGAFGVIWAMPAHIGEIGGGSLQVQDTIFVDSDTDPTTTFSTSTGLRPDQIVRQKQSDALVGVDTVLAAAKAWLQE